LSHVPQTISGLSNYLSKIIANWSLKKNGQKDNADETSNNQRAGDSTPSAVATLTFRFWGRRFDNCSRCLLVSSDFRFRFHRLQLFNGHSGWNCNCWDTVSGIEMKTKPQCQSQSQSQSQARNWQIWLGKTGQKEWIGDWQMVKRDFSHRWYFINSQKEGWRPLDQNFCSVAAFGIHFVAPDAFCLTQNNNNKAMKSKNVLLVPNLPPE